MHALMLIAVINAPTPSPTISPLPAPVVQWYADRGAEVSGLDPALVRAVIDAESGGDPKAVSKAGAIGMMQLASSTASDCGIHDLFDPMQNVECGARTLGYLVHRYGVQGGIAAYNFGSGDVDSVGGHLSKMPVETQNYVKDVVEEYDELQHESLAAASPETLDPPQPVAAFDAMLRGAQGGCDALGQARLFLPVMDQSVVELLDLHSQNACSSQTGTARLLQALAGLEALSRRYYSGPG
jgi:hypothetical protein